MPHGGVSVAGEGWIDAFEHWFPGPTGLQVSTFAIPQQDATNLPTILSDEQRTAEVCFRLPDGWSVCTVPGIFADSYRNQGFPEISQSAPDFVPPPPPGGSRYEPPSVVSSGGPQDLPEDEGTVAFHGEGSYVDWGIGALSDWFNPRTTPIYDFAGPAAQVPGPAMTPGGSCACNSNPCVCGTINGRPALVNAQTGKRCYRRRRRVMLTEGDFNTLLRIATLPNNANVRTALAKAIGRR